MNEILAQAILEALKKRAEQNGDAFQVRGDRVDIRCFQPDKHRNGDAHPSACYYPGKYIVCRICRFKESERKLAERLGIGDMHSGITLTTLAAVKKLPVEFLQSWGWRTQPGRDGRSKVLIPWYGENGVATSAPAYHIRHYINGGDISRWMRF